MKIESCSELMWNFGQRGGAPIKAVLGVLSVLCGFLNQYWESTAGDAEDCPCLRPAFSTLRELLLLVAPQPVRYHLQFLNSEKRRQYGEDFDLNQARRDRARNHRENSHALRRKGIEAGRH